ncbi:MAG TPA: prenyltransferase [Polyangia bacterium]|jgi:1,4-dihydroxy-2-naphthoate octaprenyltransferase
MGRLIAFIKLGRPQFLLGGFVLYGLGAALAVAGGAPLHRGRYLLGQLVVTATQLMTHYANDYFDLEADRANRTPTRWSGGSRILPDGALPPTVALGAARLLLLLAAAGAVLLGRRAGTTPLALAAAMISLAWSYSAPPLRLCARGLGELTTALVVTGLVPVFGYDLQAGEVAAPIFFAAALPCALQFAMLLAIEFPDAAGDAATGKRTLVVRMGALPAARLYALVTLLAFGALPLWVLAGLPARVAIAPILLAPVAVWQASRVARGAYRERARWGSVAFWAVALLIASAGLELGAAATIAGG